MFYILYIFVGLFGCYLTSSIFFLFNPLYLHKKRKVTFKTCHISHRGGCGENLENTMTAFRNAKNLGTDMFEIDVQLTADKEIVISHDNDLSRITGVDALISDTKYEDLPLITNTLNVTFGFNSKVCCSNDDRKIALLRSLLNEFPDIPLNIDVKTHNEELVDLLIEMIYEFDRSDSVVLGSMRSSTVNLIHKKDQNLILLCSISRTILIFVSFYAGLLPFIPLKETFFEIPLLQAFINFSDFPFLTRIILKFANWLIKSCTLYKHLQKRGVRVILFVLNSKKDIAYCFEELKVDGVMTDYPTVLSKYIQANSL